MESNVVNSTLNEYQSLLITPSSSQPDLHITRRPRILYAYKTAKRIIGEVTAGMKACKSLATKLSLAKREIDLLAPKVEKFAI